MAAQVKGRAFFNSQGGARVDIDYGSIAFVTTGLTVEAPTSLGVIQAGFATPQSYSGGAANGGHVSMVDRALSTAPYTSTVTRRASVDSGATFSYMFMGNLDGTSSAPRFATLQVRGGPEIQLQWGDANFVTSGLTVEVPTLLSNVLCAVATLDVHTDSAEASGNVLFCDRDVATSAVTVARIVDGGTNDGFQYLFVGGEMSNWPQNDTLGQAVLVELESHGGEPTYIQFGHDNFSGTGTTLEVSTVLSSIQSAIVLSEAGADTGAGEDVMFCDLAITSDAVTIARKVGTGSGNGFSYILIGQK